MNASKKFLNKVLAFKARIFIRNILHILIAQHKNKPTKQKRIILTSTQKLVELKKEVAI